MANATLPPTHKLCTSCQALKPVEDFHPQRRQCKDCVRVKRKAHDLLNADKIHAASKAYRLANPEKRKATERASYAKHAEKRRAAKKAYDLKNHAAVLAKMAEYRTNNRQKMRDLNKAYRLAHPEKDRATQKKRKARKRGAAINDLTAQDWVDIQAAYDYRCVYCGKRRKGHLTRDHITPLSNGGNHTKHNVVPACQPCNSKKWTGPPLVPVQPLLL